MTVNIADDLNRNDLDSQIGKAINRAISYYGFDRFWFNEKITTFATVRSQESYGAADGFPADILRLDTVNLTRNTTSKYLMVPKTYPWIVLVNPTISLGPPTCYAIYEEQIFMYPNPDQSYTVTLSYVESYTELSDSNDTNNFLSNAEDLIESRAEWWLYSRVIRDADAASNCKNAELEALTALRRKTANYIGSGNMMWQE